MSAHPRNRAPGVATALLLSATFHGACVALLPARRGVAPAPDDRAQPSIPMEVNFTPPPEEQPGPRAPPPPPPPPRRSAIRRERGAGPEAPPTAPSPKSSARGRGAAAASLGGESPPAPAPPRPMAGDAPLAPPRLVPELTSMGTLPLVEAPDGGVPGADRSAQRVVEELVRETVGRGKVDRGLVHPYFSELGRSLVARWSPERIVTEKGLSGFATQFGQNLQAWAGLYQQQAEGYARTGSPYGAELRLDPDLVPLVGNGDMQELALRRQVQRQLRERSRATRRALVRVVQDRQGRLVSVELLRKSRDPALDRTALEDVRTAALTLPVPPPEAVGERQQLVSLWEFELIVSISPPVPVVGVEFDLALKFVDVRVPLDRRVTKRVRLVSTE